MKIYLKRDSWQWWVVENGPVIPRHDDGRLKTLMDMDENESYMFCFNSRAMNTLLSGMVQVEIDKVSSCNTAKEMWDIILTSHEGTFKVKEVKLSMQDYELFMLEKDETINEAQGRFLTPMNSLSMLGRKIDQREINIKILRVMPKRFAPKVTTLQDSTTISSMETTLFGELEEFENQLRRYDEEDEAPIKKTLALQVESNNESDYEDFDEEIEMLSRKLERLLRRKKQRKIQKGSSTPVSKSKTKQEEETDQLYFMGLEDDQLEIMADHYPRGYKELKGLFFNTHGPLDTMSWFSDHGVELKTEDDGRVFPVSNNSSSIIDCLMSEAKKRGVVVQTGKVVTTASTTACGKFILKIEKRTIDYVESVEADYLLIATGSSQQGYTLATQLGHSIVDLVPSLFTFKIDDLRLAELSGVTFLKVKAKLELETVRKNIQQLTQVGPMLVTHWGLSGPVILRLSAWGARYLFSSDYKGILYVDFTPNLHIENVKSILIQHKNQFVKHKVLNSYPSELGLVKRFWKYILDREGLDGDILWASISNNSLMSVASLLKQCSFKVKGKGQFKDEFVTAGGVPLSEISLKTMESRLKSHLFLAGEVLNIDGVTGGFNFQNAWSGGYIAGTSVGNLAISATLKETVV